MLLTLLLLVSPAFPCAGLFHEEGALAESDGAEIVFEPGDGVVTVEYAVRYEGDAEGFGWIVPIPAAFDSLEEGDPERFEALREATGPTVSRIEAEEERRGCGGGAKAGGNDRALGDTADAEGGLTIVAEGFTGTYDYTVVAASRYQDLFTWLEENGWDIGSSQPAITRYVSAGYQFVALEVRPEEGATPEGGRLLPPVRITYSGTEMLFPAYMARYASEPVQRTTVWVVGDARARVSGGWTETEIETVSAPADADPATAWADALWDAAGYDPVYNVTFAGSVDGRFVTRFDTHAAREAHDADVIWTVDGGTTEARTEIVLSAYVEAGLWLLPLLGWGLRRRR